MANLLEFFRAGGLAMWPLLAISLIAVGLIVERALFFRLHSAPPTLLPQVLRACHERNFERALELCRAQPGVTAKCLALVIAHRNEDKARIEGRVEEVGAEEFLKLERGLWLLETSATVAPLLGLLGTILGMVGAFNAIAASSRSGDRSRSADAVLGGVGEALYATAAGIVVAVVCFVAANAFANRLRQITGATELAVTRAINALGDERV